MDSTSTTIATARAHARDALRGLTDNSDLEAERLLLHVLGRTESSWLLAHDDTIMSDDETALFKKYVDRRSTGEPLGYILGEHEFYGRSFFVNKNVLIPRPRTEDLVETALRRIESLSERYERPVTVADLGTGSGSIAITLACELPSTVLKKVIATDISSVALSVARKNAERHDVLSRITFVEGDLLGPLHDYNPDFIVSNPPYVPTVELSDITSSDQVGLSFEPYQALDGGSDGADFIREILKADYPVILESRGGVIIERI